MSHSKQSSAWTKGSFHVFFSLVSCCSYLYYTCALNASQQQQQPRPSDDQQQQQQASSSSSSSRHARRRRAAAHTGGQSCRWYRRRGSYSRQNGQTARREQCSNCKQTRMWPAKPQWGNLTYPSSSGGRPKHAARPPRHGARPLMHEAPLGTCNYPLQLRTPSGGARISKVSTVQFCRLYSLCGSSIALVSLFHRSVANSFDCHDATCSDSLLLPCCGCARLKYCLLYTSDAADE